MPLTRQSAAATVGGIVALIATAANPNFEPSDLNPARVTEVVKKADHNTEFMHSGAVYVLTYTVAAACLFGLGYYTVRGRLRE